MKSSATISTNTVTTRARKCASLKSSAARPQRSGRPRFASCPVANGIPTSGAFRRRSSNTPKVRLQAIGRKLANAGDFAALHGLVEGEIGSIKAIWALTAYDIAHRIGAHFGKAPRLVYLHAGTRTGARVFNISGDSFDPRILPKAFSRLAPSEIEDCLCIYKDELRDGAHSRTARRKSRCAVAVRQRCAWE